MKVAIKHPIVIDGETKFPAGTELEARRPKAKDMVIIGDHIPTLSALDRENPESAVSGAVIRAMIAVVGTLTDIGEEAASEMDFEDLSIVAQTALSSLGEAQRGGEDATGEQQ